MINPNCRFCHITSKSSKKLLDELFEKVKHPIDLENILSTGRSHDIPSLCSKLAQKEITLMSLKSANISTEEIEKFRSFYFANEIDSSLVTYIEVLDAFFFYLESLPVVAIALNEIFLACFLFLMRVKHLNKLNDSVIKDYYKQLDINSVSFPVTDITIYMYLQLVKPQSCFVDVLFFLTENYFKYLRLIKKSKKGVPKTSTEGECRFKTLTIVLSMRFYCYMKERNHFSVKNSLLYNYCIIFYMVLNHLSENEENKHYNLTIIIILMEELKIEFQNDVKENEYLFNNFVKLYDY